MKRRYLLYLIPALVLGACTSKRLSVQVLRPAELTIPRTIKKVGVVDRSFLAGAAAYMVENSYRTNRFKDIPRIGGQKTVEGFIVEFRAFKRFTVLPVQTAEKVDTSRATVPKLSDADMRAWAADGALDALVSLESYRVEITTDGNIYTSLYYDTAGKPYAVPRFQGRRGIKVTTFWRIYNLKDFTVINECTMETQLNFSSNGYSPDETYRNLPEKLGNVENSSQVAGMKYAQSLLPYWQNTDRLIYLGQTNAWLEAADSAEVGNWESAAEQWRRLEKKSPFPVIQRQAVFNLFTAYEVLGNFDEAEYWARLGQRKFKNRDFDAAVLFLDKRRIENSQLDEQLNE